MSVFDGVQRVLFVHAHPDDETLATGALIIELVERGIECVVLTATRGEQGGIVAGRFNGLAGEEFIQLRETELAGALAELAPVRRCSWVSRPPGPTGCRRGAMWTRGWNGYAPASLDPLATRGPIRSPRPMRPRPSKT